MPSGRIAVGVLDASGTRFVGIAAPVQVTAGRDLAIAPHAPAAGSASLVLELNRPSLVKARPDDDVSVALRFGNGRSELPAVLTRGARKLTAVWTGIPVGDATLEVRSSTCHLLMRDVRLASGEIEHIIRDLSPLPTLGVRVVVPERLRRGPVGVTILDLSGDAEPIELEVEDGAELVEHHVPAAPLKVSAVSGPWTVEERIDLSDGRDGTVDLIMRPIRMTGRVWVGDEPARARLSFDTRRDWEDSLTVETDEEGHFEALFAAPDVYFATVAIDGSDGVYGEPGILVEEDVSHDFRLPGNRYRFVVANRLDGSRVANAEIRLENASSDGITTNQSLTTDSSGEAVAPPLRPGSLTVAVNAEGFEPSQPFEVPVGSTGGRPITIELEPRDGAMLSLLLPSGAPAAGANVFIVPTAGTSWAMRADERGRLRLPPNTPAALILVRAEGAAFGARPWTGDDLTWTLDPRAPPLVVRSVAPDGLPAPNTPAILWIDGIRLDGGPLGWLTSTPGGSDAAGLWRLDALPQRPVEILFWRSTPQNVALVPQGLFDGMRERVSYPRPDVVTLHALP